MSAQRDPDDILEAFEALTARASKPVLDRPKRRAPVLAVSGALGALVLVVVVVVVALNTRVPPVVGPASTGNPTPSATLESPEPTSAEPTSAESSASPTPVPSKWGPLAVAQPPPVFFDEPGDGFVRIAEHCSYLETWSGIPTLLVWPSTMTKWLPDSRTIEFTTASGVVVIADGQQVRLSGSHKGGPPTGLAWVARPHPTCPDAAHFEVGEVRLEDGPGPGPRVVADCRTLDVPEPEGERNTGLAWELGIAEIDYNDDGYGNGVRMDVEFLDPACLEHPIIGPMIDHVMSDVDDYPGCEYLRELLESGTIGYRGRPVPADEVDGYMVRWCSSATARPLTSHAR